MNKVLIGLLMGLISTNILADARLIASQCYQCHGTNGKGPGFEKLTGMDYKEIVEEMMEMKYSTRVEGIMDRQAKGYTDEQIYDLANFISNNK